MKPTILLLTNYGHKPLINEIEAEDVFLADYLQKHFHVILAHPLDCQKIESSVDAIIIRNIWPQFVYEKEFRKMLKRFRKKKLRTYNPLTGKGDLKGKDHLVTLFKKGFPVIPTVDSIKEIDLLPKTKSYFVKPKNTCDAIGAGKFSKNQLKRKRLGNHIIQPYVDFQYELSFYVIDGKIVHTISTPNKLKSIQENVSYKTTPYQPNNSEKRIIQSFIKWNSLEFGLQRFDACMTKDNKLLLMEIEDICPYLNLRKYDKKVREQFLQTLVKSIKKNVL